MYCLLLTLGLVLSPVSADENPCKNITVGSCTLGEDVVVEGHPYSLDLCHLLCSLNDKCQFWRHDLSEEGSSDECLFLSTDYHQVLSENVALVTLVPQDCRTVAGPVEGDMLACNQVDKTTCGSIILEDCQYSGTRLGEGIINLATGIDELL